MNISNFFDSYIGMYIAQAFCHSLTSALIIDRAVQAWKITNPLMRQRFSLIVLGFPIVSFPAYQIINPDRGSISFRLETLFDINRWLNLELWGKVPLGLLFILVLTVTALVFLFQEMIPIVRHTLESRKSASEETGPCEDPVIDGALEHLPGEKPRVSVIDEDEFILFSTTGKKPVIFLSSGLIEALSGEELQAAIAHEIAHIERNRRPLLTMVFLIRMLMFFNPVVLVEFRRIVQEEEKICDDIAVSLTQKPRALAEILKKFSYKREDINLDKVKNLSTLSATLEDYSHSVHIESRIARLEGGAAHTTGNEWFRFLLTLAVIIVMNYFIV